MTKSTLNKHITKIRGILNKDYNHEQPYIPMTREFTRAYRTMIRTMIKERGWGLSAPSGGGYCELYLFINNGREGEDRKYVHLMTSDFRYWNEEWKDRILIRTANSEKDYSGGYNNYTNLENLVEQVERLFAQ